MMSERKIPGSIDYRDELDVKLERCEARLNEYQQL